MTVPGEPRTSQPRHTAAVTARTSGRLSRLKLAYPDQAQHPAYDAALARELLARTRELPTSRRALITLLTEYRHALTALATAPGTCDHPGHR